MALTCLFLRLILLIRILWTGVLAHGEKITHVPSTQHLDVLIVHSIADDLIYDSNNRLAQHHLVFDSLECVDDNDTPIGTFQTYLQQHPSVSSRLGVERVDGYAREQVFGSSSNDSNSCRAAWLERGTERSYAGNVLPHALYDSQRDGDIAKWFAKNCLSVEVCFLNYHTGKETGL